jgi:hypothetical protein
MSHNSFGVGGDGKIVLPLHLLLVIVKPCFDADGVYEICAREERG